MQVSILEALTLTMVGNAALRGKNGRGKDVRGFWPNASVFRYTQGCEFLAPDDHGEMRQVAADPNAWLAAQRQAHLGFRLHNLPSAREAGQLGHIEERMLVGFVGGGPRWVIEAVGRERSQLWEGGQRLVDRDPAGKIWAHAYFLRGETAPQSAPGPSLAATADDLRGVLKDAEGLAHELDADSFRDCFTTALAALAGKGARGAGFADLTRYGEPSPEALALLDAVGSAWVFGGMGSWNDIGAPDGLRDRYDRVSEALFVALCQAISAAANSTFPAPSTQD